MSIDQTNPDPPAWRRQMRHVLTVLLIGLYCALAGPTIATVLLALRANGLSFDLVYSPMIAPMAMLYAGPGAFVLGLVFGWMMLVLVQMGLNLLPLRVGVAMLIATVVWALAEPLPTPGESGTAEGAVAPAAMAASQFADWLVWNATAAATALLFTRRWLARRVFPPE